MRWFSRIFGVVSVLGSLSTAHALPIEEPAPGRDDPEPVAHVQYGLQLVWGLSVVTRDDGTRVVAGPALALRPVVTFGGRSRDRARPAFYGELATNGVQRDRGPILAAGLELVIPFGESGAVSPSIGSYRRFRFHEDRGVEAGLFFGMRERGANAIDASAGLRIDARVGVGPEAERAVVIGISGDMIAGAGMLAWFL